MQAEAQEKEIEEMTSVEIEDDSEVVEDSEEQQELSEADSDDEQELRDYESPNKKKNDPQRRIRQLTAARKQAEEEAAAAVEYAKQIQAQNEQYKQSLSTLDKGYMSEYEGRITSQEVQAKRALAEAHEAGDYDKVADAQSAIAQIAIEKERLRVQKNKSQAQAQTQQQVQPQQQPRQQERDPKLESWLEKNTWFGKDRIMTSVARGIHETLIAEEGFNPTTDEYYAEIDKRIRQELPNKFQGDKKNVQSVTPAGSGNRSLKNGRKKQVELNPGQVKLAQKLGIPLDKYAAEVQRLADRRD